RAATPRRPCSDPRLRGNGYPHERGYSSAPRASSSAEIPRVGCRDFSRERLLSSLSFTFRGKSGMSRFHPLLPICARYSMDRRRPIAVRRTGIPPRISEFLLALLVVGL